jgi:nicotinamidase-related amidase
MSSIVYLRALSDPSITPCLVLVDMQKEYLAGQRLMAMPEARAALKHCRAALYHARSIGLPIAHVRQISRSSYFNPITEFYGWIDGFQPVGADMIFDRNLPSCYANKQFSDLMDSSGGHFIIAGFAGETACLSTAIDAYHRNHHFTFLADASASHRLGRFSATAVHETISEVIGTYGRVLDTNTWISDTSDVTVVSRDHVDVEHER